MGTMLDALLHLQSTQRDLVHVQKKLQREKNAVTVQEGKIQQLREEAQQLHEQATHRRSEADRYDLELRSREEHVNKLRTALNTAKTNKEYASILTQINTAKADNAKLEEKALQIMQQADNVNEEAGKLTQQIAEQEERLREIHQESSKQIEKLSAMAEEISAKREQAAAQIPPEVLAIFERIADNYDGEAMAPIEIRGKKPPYEYICGGCFMTLNAEHVNALRMRDEVRTCDNCRRILYLQTETEKSRT